MNNYKVWGFYLFIEIAVGNGIRYSENDGKDGRSERSKGEIALNSSNQKAS